MDQERTLLIAAVGFAVAIGCFVLWGPTPFTSKKRKNHVVGLVNLGFTCFLNTLLQALASCPILVEWLVQQENMSECSLTATLRTVLLVLNGGQNSSVDDPYTPSDIIAALKRHKWVISPGEQDVHELFHIVLETLEEEIIKSSVKNGCLSDLLDDCRGQGDNHTIHKHFVKQDKSVNVEGTEVVQRKTSSSTPQISVRNQSANSSSCSLNLDKQYAQYGQLPFRGMLTSQLKCTTCGFKTSLRFDKFDTLSLPLPTSYSSLQPITLQMLLDDFISPEIVKDVTCANCSRGQNKPVQTAALKTLNLGKLPKCLCIHIVRTTWNLDSYKRDDYVDFPEFLNMDNYTHTQIQRNNRKLENHHLEVAEGRNNHSVQNTKVQLAEPNILNGDASRSDFSQRDTTRVNHLYRLKSVIVHTGTVHSGHFVTYRKGPIQSLNRHRLHKMESNVRSSMGQHECRESSRWFYTSDAVVREATLFEALRSNAYMLFYEKCHVQ